MDRPVPDGFIELTYHDDYYPQEEYGNRCTRIVNFSDIRHYQVRDASFFIVFGETGSTRASRMEYIPFTSVRDFVVYPNSDAYLSALEEYQEQCDHDWEGIPSSSPFQPDHRVCTVCELAEPIVPLDPSEERTEL